MAYNSAATRARLLDAAYAEFVELGFAGARVGRIATAAAANKQAIYAYFGSKEALFDAVLGDRLQVLADVVPFTPDDLPGYIGALFDALTDDPGLLRLTQWKALERPEASPGALGLFAYVVGNAVYSKYLLFPYIPGAGELLIFCSAIAGAGLAFLWFNAHPAQVFMGDVGALSLGGALGTIAVITRQEIVLGIMGGVFVAEALSVMAQVSYFKYTKRKYGEGRRILKMAPLHHHFEKSGWTETQVVIRFWIVTMLLCLVGLASLKLR